MNEEQRELARHALGLPNFENCSYRNRFVTDRGCPDHDIWLQMVDAGHAWRLSGSELTGGGDLFGMTETGAKSALESGERLCSEDFPRQIADASTS